MDIHTALKIVGQPVYVKTAADASPTFDTRGGTFLTAVQALVKNASDQDVKDIDGFARFWNITQDVLDAREKWAAYHQLPEPDEQDYALSVEHQGHQIRKFAAYDSESTAKAARHFADQRHLLPLEWRQKTASELLKRAEKFDAQLPEYAERALEKSACQGQPTVERLRDLVAERVKTAHARFEPELEKLSQLVGLMVKNDHLLQDRQFVKDAATTFEQFDHYTGISSKYASGEVSLPEEMIDDWSTDSLLAKTASPSRAELVNGRTVDVRSLSKEALAVVDADLVSLPDEKLAEVLPTLPKEDADLLVRLAS